MVRSKYVTIVCGPWRQASCRDEVKSLKKRLLGMPSEREREAYEVQTEWAGPRKCLQEDPEENP